MLNFAFCHRSSRCLDQFARGIVTIVIIQDFEILDNHYQTSCNTHSLKVLPFPFPRKKPQGGSVANGFRRLRFKIQFFSPLRFPPRERNPWPHLVERSSWFSALNLVSSLLLSGKDTFKAFIACTDRWNTIHFQSARIYKQRERTWIADPSSAVFCLVACLFSLLSWKVKRWKHYKLKLFRGKPWPLNHKRNSLSRVF